MAAENLNQLMANAQKNMLAGKLDLALRDFQKYLELRPNDEKVKLWTADILIKLNRQQEAFAHLIYLADYYNKEGFPQKSIAVLKRVVNIDPHNEVALSKLADFYIVQGLTLEAKQIYMNLMEEYKRRKDTKRLFDVYKKMLDLDRDNINLRLLVASNYLREGYRDEAINEYLIAVDQLIRKKDYQQAENCIKEVFDSTRDSRLLSKLVIVYNFLERETEAIHLLEEYDQQVRGNPELLKILGDLYLKKGNYIKAEEIFKQVVQLDPEEHDALIKLGKAYLQNEEVEKAFMLFCEIIDNYYLPKDKIEDAVTLLRFIVTSHNNYLPALEKMAEIYKKYEKTNSLLAIYETLIMIYEERGMKDRLKVVLEEMLKISDNAYIYKEKLDKLLGKKEIDQEEKQLREFVSFNLRMADEAIKREDYNRAYQLLLTAKNAYPRETEIRYKLVELFELKGDLPSLISEGVDLLQLLKDLNREQELRILLERLLRLSPNDERLLDFTGYEKTNIEIDFDHSELLEQIEELKEPEKVFHEEPAKEEEILELSSADSIAITPEKDYFRSLSTQLNQVDFFINEGFLDNAEEILRKLKETYPESTEVIKRFERIKQAAEATRKKQDSKVKNIVNMKIASNLAEESNIIQVQSDQALKIEESSIFIPETFPKKKEQEIEKIEDLKIEMERVEEEQLFDSARKIVPPVEKKVSPNRPFAEKTSPPEDLTSIADFLNIDSILSVKEEKAPQIDIPFKEVDEEISFESEDIFKSEELFKSENYERVEKLVKEEQEAIKFWVDELQKYRTSTIERNMMEIFKEFKKGVEEKIGQEDYETRYQLGIAYKEMGLIDEAIHEFLISSKHPNKFFDSAGLLGICFRNKGMVEEAMSWFERALKVQGRAKEEYLAIKFEMVLTAMQKEDYSLARKLAMEISAEDSEYRNIKEIINQLQQY